MRIYFKEKPTIQEISRYENKLNYFLQYLNVKIKIKLLNKPIRIESFINNEHTDTTYNWVDFVEVTTPETVIGADLFSQHLGHEGGILDEKYAWGDAFEIQNTIYRKLKRIPFTPPDSMDPYWKLWDHIKSKK